MSPRRLRILAFLLLMGCIVTADPFSWLDVSQDEMQPDFLTHPAWAYRYHSPESCCPLPQLELSTPAVKVHSAVLSFRVNSAGRLLADPMLDPEYSTHLRHVVARIADVVKL